MKKLLVAATFSMASLLSVSAKAYESIDSLKGKMDNAYKASLVKNDGFYYVELKSEAFYDHYGQRASILDGTKYGLRRKILIPVSVDEKKKKGLDAHFQIGLEDDDEKTGEFSSETGKQIKDLFTTYKGKAGNFGILVGGAGYASAHSDSGIKLSDISGAIIIGPAGTPFGVSVGAQAYGFEFKISTPMRAVEVKHELQLHGEGSKRYQSSEVMSIDDVLDAALLN